MNFETFEAGYFVLYQRYLFIIKVLLYTENSYVFAGINATSHVELWHRQSSLFSSSDILDNSLLESCFIVSFQRKYVVEEQTELKKFQKGIRRAN